MGDVSLTGKKSVEVRIVGPALVVAFRAARPRLVWRFDLEKNHSFSIALEGGEGGEEGEWELGVTSPKGEFYPVARFAAREDAEGALAAVQQTLMRGKCGFFGRKLRIFALFVLLLFAVLYAADWLAAHTAPPNPAPAIVAPPPEPHGSLPVPADQVLRPPP